MHHICTYTHMKQTNIHDTHAHNTFILQTCIPTWSYIVEHMCTGYTDAHIKCEHICKCNKYRQAYSMNIWAHTWYTCTHTALVYLYTWYTHVYTYKAWACMHTYDSHGRHTCIHKDLPFIYTWYILCTHMHIVQENMCRHVTHMYTYSMGKH